MSLVSRRSPVEAGKAGWFFKQISPLRPPSADFGRNDGEWLLRLRRASLRADSFPARRDKLLEMTKGAGMGLIGLIMGGNRRLSPIIRIAYVVLRSA